MKRLLLLFISASTALPALARPTAEEEALLAVLEGRDGAAVSILEGAVKVDPVLRWVAARVALGRGDLGTARRLFSGDDPASLWGRVDLALKAGDARGAAEEAMAEMDRALKGVHREAIVRMIVKWAAEIREKDSATAERMIEAVLALEMPDPLRAEAEDMLFGLQDATVSNVASEAARRRLLTKPEDLLALRVAGHYFAAGNGDRALRYLEPVVGKADRKEALKAAKAVTVLAAPAALRVALLDALGGRFPADEEVAKLRLTFAKAMMAEDPAMGDAALSGLSGDPLVGAEAMEAWAAGALDPEERRARWLMLSKREGLSARGERARKEAKKALETWVAGQPEGEARRSAALRALKEPDGTGDPAFLYAALDPGGGRLKAMWDLAERFPGAGPWCGDVARSLVGDGASPEEGERFKRVCSGASGDEAQAVLRFAAEEESVVVAPRDGVLMVYATGARTLKVTENKVDAGALFRASDDDPMKTRMDAFLMQPDVSYELTLDPRRLKAITLKPRSASDLVAVQVRGGEKRATALVAPDPLRVEAIVKGDTVAVAAFRDEVPAGGAEVLVRHGDGKEDTLKTDGGGVAIAGKVEGPVRVLVGKAGAIGFARVDGASEVEKVEDEYVLVPWDRALPAEGTRARVQVLGARRGGEAAGKFTMVSTTSAGTPLDSANVTVERGAGMAELWLQGGGSVSLKKGDDVLASSSIPLAMDREATGMAISFSPAAPGVGDRLTITVHDTGPGSPDGRAARIVVRTPWTAKTENTLLKDNPWSLVVDLSMAAPGDRIDVEADLAGDTAHAFVNVSSGSAPRAPSLPAVVVVNEVARVDVDQGCWLLATAKDGRHRRWVKPGGEFSLPVEGQWMVAAWRSGVTSAQVPVLVVERGDEIGNGGSWKGKFPTLWALTGDRIRDARVVRPGGSVGVAAGSVVAWAAFGAERGVALPIHARPVPELTMTASLVRGKAGALTLGEGLPAGTRLWAFLHDASDSGSAPSAASLGLETDAGPPDVAERSELESVEGEEIAQGLLEEEKRLAEQSRMERIDLLKADVSERVVAGGMEVRGYGAGGGGIGLGSGAHSVVGRVGRGWSRARSLGFTGNAIAVLAGGTPGEWRVEVPASVSQAQVLVYARTPDGRWLAGARRFDVGGVAPVARKETPSRDIPTEWDGTHRSLTEVARGLSPDARCLALVALAKHGFKEAGPPLAASLPMQDDEESGRILAHHMGGHRATDASGSLQRLEGLPDQRRAERVMAALEGAREDPERASATARRLLRDNDLEPWVAARAGLALWVAGQQAEAAQALSGDDPWTTAARVVTGGAADRRHLGVWWAVARNRAAPDRDRGLAIAALSAFPGKPVAPAPVAGGAGSLKPMVLAPLAEIEGRTFRRALRLGTPEDPRPEVPAVDRMPAMRETLVVAVVPAHPLPTRLQCPSGESIEALATGMDLDPSPAVRWVSCRVRATREGATRATVTWHGPYGEVLARGETALTVEAPRASSASDPMSVGERMELGRILALRGDASGMALLKGLVSAEGLAPGDINRASEALLEGAVKAGDPASLVAAFEAFRERSGSGSMPISTAAAVAHAYEKTGIHARAVAASRVVLDARFREEISAFQQIKKAGLTLTALHLLKELVGRYPEVGSVVQARYLAPSVLLELATSGGERAGLTKSSLRHTAAAEMARFLLVHPDSTQAPEAAVLLSGILQMLRDPAREQALAGPLAEKYRASPKAWMLTVADARARFARGRFGEAEGILRRLKPPPDGEATVALELGKVLEATGRRDAAIEEYNKAGGVQEASARVGWLERLDFEMPALRILHPWDPQVIEAQLRPGTKVAVTAYRIALENLLLRDDGRVEPDGVRVDGLKPEASVRAAVDATGNVPLPSLPMGAYLVTVTLGDDTRRGIVMRTDAVLTVETGAGGILVHLTDSLGRPLRDARLWSFGGGGDEGSERTDAMGSAWLTAGAGVSILARAGDAYAWHQAAPAGRPPRPSRQSVPSAPNPAPAFEQYQKKNVMEFDEMFIDGEQRVKANAL